MRIGLGRKFLRSERDQKLMAILSRAANSISPILEVMMRMIPINPMKKITISPILDLGPQAAIPFLSLVHVMQRMAAAL